jgi:hypothetical protein
MSDGGGSAPEPKSKTPIGAIGGPFSTAWAGRAMAIASMATRPETIEAAEEQLLDIAQFRFHEVIDDLAGIRGEDSGSQANRVKSGYGPEAPASTSQMGCTQG